jgi:tetratricopeptide (TPR) repeat protein
MEVLFSWFSAAAQALNEFIAFATTWMPGDETQKRVGFWASVVTLGLFAIGLISRVRSPAPAASPYAATKEDIAAFKAELLAELRAKEATGSPGGPAAPASGDGLARDLDAAIETLLAAGKAEALRDKSGRDAEAAIDQLIAERATAREKIASDEAALWRQKGALAFLHDTQSALAAYRRATGLDPDDADGWNQLGQLYDRTGDLDDAIAAYERVLALGNRSADQATIAAATGNLGEVYRIRGDLDRAEEMYEKSLDLNEALGRKEGMASNYGNLGIVYATRGDLDRAEERYKKSLTVEKALGRKEGLAADYGNLGIVYRIRCDLDRAEEMHKKSLDLDEALGRKEGMANQYGNLGALEEQRGNITAACAHWTKARDLFCALGAPHMVEKVEGLMRDAGCPDG